MIKFIKDQFSSFQLRDDYRELRLLTIVFLGSNTENGIKICSPGADYRAKWMCKIMYSIKIYMFRGQFKLKAAELYGIQQFNVLMVRVYMQKCFTCQCLTLAPLKDLHLLQDFLQYSALPKMKKMFCRSSCLISCHTKARTSS